MFDFKTIKWRFQIFHGRDIWVSDYDAAIGIYIPLGDSLNSSINLEKKIKFEWEKDSLYVCAGQNLHKTIDLAVEYIKKVLIPHFSLTNYEIVLVNQHGTTEKIIEDTDEYKV